MPTLIPVFCKDCGQQALPVTRNGEDVWECPIHGTRNENDVEHQDGRKVDVD